MRRLVSFFVLSLFAAVQAVSQAIPSSDPVAVSMAAKSMAALTGGLPITDATLHADVTWIMGSDSEMGTGTLTAKGISEARVDLNLTGGTRTDVRNVTNGLPAGGWNAKGGTSTAYAQHNSWTDAGWFFPALFSLAQSGNPNFVFSYVGQEQHGGVTVEHIRNFQMTATASKDISTAQRLSTMDFYLDPLSFLPLAVSFNAHADNDLNVDIPIEVRFAKYQPVSGIQVPFHIQKMLNGGVVLDITVTNAILNSGLLDSSFVLP
jgi:hypothetical protein